jgi:hypothetical protein
MPSRMHSAQSKLLAYTLSGLLIGICVVPSLAIVLRENVLNPFPAEIT